MFRSLRMRSGGFAVAATVLAGFLIAPVGGQEKGEKKKANIQEPGKDSKENADSKAVQDLQLAHQLISYGRHNKHAESLLIAAQILHKTATQPLKAKHQVKGKKEKAEGPARVDNSPKALLAEAKKMSSSPAVKALAKATEIMLEESTRSAVGGPRKDAFTINGLQTINWTAINFYGNQKAEVLVLVDINSRMVLEVRDQFGNVVARDNAPGNYYHCYWYPSFTGPYYVRLINNNNIYFNCVLVTN